LWSVVEKSLSETPAQMKVAKTIVELGLHVESGGKVYCGIIEISPTKIARAIGVDRRVVSKTVEAILAHPDLREIYTNIMPAGPFFRKVAKRFGFGLIEIMAEPKTVGIIAKTSTLISQEGISIRQIIADDPDIYPEPKLTIITDKEVPGRLISEFVKIPGVKKVSIS
jgi:predicted regulator of amino acid metabolism with ACT domain